MGYQWRARQTRIHICLLPGELRRGGKDRIAGGQDVDVRLKQNELNHCTRDAVFRKPKVRRRQSLDGAQPTRRPAVCDHFVRHLHRNCRQVRTGARRARRRCDTGRNRPHLPLMSAPLRSIAEMPASDIGRSAPSGALTGPVSPRPTPWTKKVRTCPGATFTVAGSV
jgi:hypothetical protein